MTVFSTTLHTATRIHRRADGTVKAELFTPDNIHLSPAGYVVYTERPKPLLEETFHPKWAANL